MNVYVKLISDTEETVIKDTSARTIDDLYEELMNEENRFIKIGKRVIQKASIEYLYAE